MLRGPRNEEQQWNHARAEDREIADDINVTPYRRLTMQLVVDHRLRCMQRSRRGWTRGASGDAVCEASHPIHKRWIGRRKLAHHIAFMSGDAPRQHGGEEGCTA